MTVPLIALDDASQIFRAGDRPIKAVDRVSLEVAAGEVVCLVGESGCGKTTSGKMLAGLLKPTSGRVLFEGQDIWRLDEAGFRRFRKAVQIIHQDPYASLNPVRTIYQTLSAPLLHHKLVNGERATRAKVIELLELVDLTPAADLVDKYPHQLSGGQRQRVSVARALTVNPSVIVADEAVSMVDVSIRVSLLNMLTRLKERLGVTFLFITHDLALAKYFAWEGRIVVMYLGRVAEIGPTPQIINNPMHPYTRALLAAIPEADPELTRKKERLELRSQEIPSLLNLPSGCTFHPRCPLFVAGTCDRIMPDLYDVGNGQRAACHVTAGQIQPESEGASFGSRTR